MRFRRFEERVTERDVELARVDVVEEQVDAAEVVRRRFLFLPVEADEDVLRSEDLCHLHQERPRTAGRIVDLPHPRPAPRGDAGQQLRGLLRREELSAGLARARGIHRQQVFVGVAEGVDGPAPVVAELHLRHAAEQRAERLVLLVHRGPQLARVAEVDRRKDVLEVFLALRALRRVFDFAENVFERDVEVVVPRRRGVDAGEKVRRAQEEPELAHEDVLRRQRIRVRERGVGEPGHAGRPLLLVRDAGDLFRQEPVEQRAQDVLLEVPAAHRPAQLVRDPPDCLVQFRTLALLRPFVFLFVHGPAVRLHRGRG